MDLPQSFESVAVFCGSRPGNDPSYLQAAGSLGRCIANRGKCLVYGGGGDEGIMGAVSQAASDAGGRVIGITPLAMLPEKWLVQFKEEYVKTTCQNGREPNFSDRGMLKNIWEAPLCGDWVTIKEKENQLTEIMIVHSMHERKFEMTKRANAFFCLPGGFGTFEEILETVTWIQIGIHHKPIFLLNVLGFFEPLRALITGCVNAGFIESQHQRLLVFIDGPSDLSLHHDFPWGEVAMNAMIDWKQPSHKPLFNWMLCKAESIPPKVDSPRKMPPREHFHRDSSFF